MPRLADGQSVADLVGLPPTPISLGMDHFVASPPREFDDPAEAAFQQARSVAHPVGTFHEPVRLHGSLDDLPVERTYVEATGSKPDDPGESHFREAAAWARRSDRWRYLELDSNHMVLCNRPEELAAILLDLAYPTAAGRRHLRVRPVCASKK